MSELLAPVSGGDRMVLVLVTVVMTSSMLMLVAKVGFGQWRRVREREAATALVHDMLARGFTPHEIERVLTGAGISRHPSHDG